VQGVLILLRCKLLKKPINLFLRKGKNIKQYYLTFALLRMAMHMPRNKC
jgi:hypothetical protein